jgi:hypothetical protein
MFDDEMENLFSRFEKKERAMRKKARQIESTYIEIAMRKYQDEMLTFAKTLLEGTGVVLSKELNDEA